jgi:argininosuccinate synthase
MADVGQEEDFEAAKEKALKIGASKCYVEDLRREVSELIQLHLQKPSN